MWDSVLLGSVTGLDHRMWFAVDIMREHRAFVFCLGENHIPCVAMYTSCPTNFWSLLTLRSYGVQDGAKFFRTAPTQHGTNIAIPNHRRMAFQMVTLRYLIKIPLMKPFHGVLRIRWMIRMTQACCVRCSLPSTSQPAARNLQLLIF